MKRCIYEFGKMAIFFSFRFDNAKQPFWKELFEQFSVLLSFNQINSI
jgi:hypothetical protein